MQFFWLLWYSRPRRNSSWLKILHGFFISQFKAQFGWTRETVKEGAGRTEGYGHLCRWLQTSFLCVMHIQSQRANFPVEKDLISANSIVCCAIYRTLYLHVQIYNREGIFHWAPEFHVIQREYFQSQEKSPREVLTDLWCSRLPWLYKLIPIFKSILKSD